MTEATSELLMFQVGSRLYAAQVGDVRRIGSPRHEPADSLVEATPLGEPFVRDRGIVVSCGGDGDRTLLVDMVLGVRSVADADLRPLPPLAATVLQSEAITGFAVIDGAPTLLIDLPTLLREQRRQDAADPDEPRPRHA